MPPRRLAYVVSVFPKLSETFIAHELAELRRRGVDVRVLSLHQPGEQLRHEFIARAGLYDITSYETRAFVATLREFRPQLVHAHFATAATAVARKIAIILGVPFTFTAHRYDIYASAPPDFAARAAAASAVVTVSQANVRHIVGAFGVPAEHLRVIPCGVDTGRFKPGRSQWSEDQSAPPIAREDGAGFLAASGAGEEPLIVCVARHVVQKNLGLLLDACAMLRRRGVKFRCVSVGDGPRRPGLEAKRAQLGLDDVVQFAGAAEHNEVLRWWQRARIAALTSESEGMPVCLMEAAACGVPAVATAVGGVPELIADGVTGLLAPPNDPEAFATALQRLLEEPGLAAQMGLAARRRAEERFSLAHQVDALLELWREILASKRPGQM